MPLSHLFEDFKDPYQYTEQEIEHIVVDLKNDLKDVKKNIYSLNEAIEDLQQEIDSTQQEMNKYLAVLSDAARNKIVDMKSYSEARRKIPALKLRIDTQMRSRSLCLGELEEQKRFKKEIQALIKEGKRIMKIERVFSLNEKGLVKPSFAPRYDEVFEEGTAWLDSLEEEEDKHG